MELSDFTIIVPTKNEEKNITRFLSSLPQEVKLIVVDASTDNTVEVIKKARPNNTKVISKALPITPSRQLGAENATTEWLIFTDADVNFDEDYFDRLLKKDLHDAFYGAKLSADEYISYYQDFTRWQQRFHNWGVPAVSGSNVGIKKMVLEKIGGFDLDLSVNEDTELGFAVKRQGYTIDFFPDIIVYVHDHRRLKKGTLKKNLHSFVRSALLYFQLMPVSWKKDSWGYWK